METINHMNLLAEVYESEEMAICMRNIPRDIRDDVKQHVFVILMGLPSTFIVDLYQRAKLKRYVVKCLLNAFKHERSSWNYGKPKETYSDDMDQYEEICNFEYNEVTLDLSWLNWYDSKILELYVEHGTFRKVAELTGIPLTSIYDTIKNIRKKVKYKMTAEEFLDDRYFFYTRVLNGIDCHLSNDEAKEFERLAKLISPHQDFPWRGCQECANHLVKFVYTNRKKIKYGDS